MKDGYLPQSDVTLHILKFVGRVQWITTQFVGRVQWITTQFHGGYLASWNVNHWR